MLNIWLPVWRKPWRSLLLLGQVLLGTAVTALALRLATAEQYVDPRLAQVFTLHAGEQEKSGASGYALFRSPEVAQWKALLPDAEMLTLASNYGEAEVQVGVQRFLIMNADKVWPNFADFYDIKPWAGRFFTAQDQRVGSNAAVLSLAASRALFGTEQSLGRTFKVLQRYGAGQRKAELRQVVGLIDETEIPRGLVAPTLYLPMSGAELRERMFEVQLRAKPGRMAAAQEQVLSAARQSYRNDPVFIENKRGLYIDTPGREAGRLPPRPTYFILAALSLSVTGLTLLSSQMGSLPERTRELGFRRLLGATRSRIVRDLLGEVLLIGSLGAVLGVVMAGLGWPLLRHLNSGETDAIPFSWSLAGLTAAGVLVTALLFSLYPALLAARLRPNQAARSVN